MKTGNLYWCSLTSIVRPWLVALEPEVALTKQLVCFADSTMNLY